MCIRDSNMVNFGLLTAEIRWRVWGTPANFNEFRVWAALLHVILVVGVSQTLQLMHWQVYRAQNVWKTARMPPAGIVTVYLRPHWWTSAPGRHRCANEHGVGTAGQPRNERTFRRRRFDLFPAHQGLAAAIYIHRHIYHSRGTAVKRISIPGTRRACTTHFAWLYDDGGGGQTDAHLSVTFRQDDVPPVIGPYDDLRRFYHTTRARIRRTS